MVSANESTCPRCGGQLCSYGRVKRIVRTKGRKTSWIEIERKRCSKCKVVHRALPQFIFPYKQYESEVIIGVLEGLITTDTLGYEDYPCEATMKSWLLQPTSFLQDILFNLE